MSKELSIETDLIDVERLNKCLAKAKDLIGRTSVVSLHLDVPYVACGIRIDAGTTLYGIIHNVENEYEERSMVFDFLHGPPMMWHRMVLVDADDVRRGTVFKDPGFKRLR